MGKKCWMCDFETDLTDNDFGDHLCPNCGVMISIYGQEIKTENTGEEKTMTTQEEWLLRRETEQKEESVKVENASISPFFKKGMLPEGAIGKIKGEFTPSGQYNNYTGEVDFDGTVLKVSLNKTSLYNIVAEFGNDTLNWKGKQIVLSVEDVENKKTNALYRGVCVWKAFK